MVVTVVPIDGSSLGVVSQKDVDDCPFPPAYKCVIFLGSVSHKVMDRCPLPPPIAESFFDM